MTFSTTPVSDPNTSGQPAQPTTPDQGASGTVPGMTPEQIQEIVKRDAHAQQHIANIENENKSMREDLAKFQDELKTFKDKLAAQSSVEEILKRTSTSTQQTQQPAEQTPEFDFNKVEELVTQRVQKIFTEQEQQQNYSQAAAELSGIFKDKADEHVTKVARENGMSYEDAQQLARTNPTMFTNVFVKPYAQGSNSTPAPTQSDVSTNTNTVPATQAKDEYAAWMKMRKEEPNKFYTPATQRQWHTWFHANKQFIN